MRIAEIPTGEGLRVAVGIYDGEIFIRVERYSSHWMDWYPVDAGISIVAKHLAPLIAALQKAVEV